MSTEETKLILNQILETQNTIKDGQSILAATVTEQHRMQDEKLDNLVKDAMMTHEEKHHPNMDPDHHEQHKRLGGWQSRIDSMWKVVFNSIAFFMLVAIGYGIITIIDMKQSEHHAQVQVDESK